MNTTLLVLLIFVPILAVILLGLNTLLAPHRAYESKLSAYECGMPAFLTQTRESFQIHFYLVTMLFLVFDIELVLLLPVSVSLSAVSTYGFTIAMVFFIILTVGFILELGTNSISLKPSKSDKSITPILWQQTSGLDGSNAIAPEPDFTVGDFSVRKQTGEPQTNSNSNSSNYDLEKKK